MPPNDFSQADSRAPETAPDPASDAAREAEEDLVRALVGAYRKGIFPMAEPGVGGGEAPVYWYDPDPRGILPIVPGDPAGEFRVSKTLAQRVRRGLRGETGLGQGFRITSDRAFGEVIRACADPRSRPSERDVGGWIDGRIIHAYEALHRAGWAHSVEAWVDPAPGSGEGPRLVGGLYGVAIGGLFAGESMFTRPDLGGTDASKVCLVHLVEHLRRRGYTLLDTQMTTEHIARFGGVEISRAEYQQRLGEAVGLGVEWGTFDADTMSL